MGEESSYLLGPVSVYLKVLERLKPRMLRKLGCNVMHDLNLNWGMYITSRRVGFREVVMIKEKYCDSSPKIT